MSQTQPSPPPGPPAPVVTSRSRSSSASPARRVVVASLFIRKEAFAVVAVLAVGAGLWELAQAFTRRDIHLPLLPLLVGAIGILVSAYTAGPEALFVAFMLTVGGVVVWRVLDGSGQPALRDATAGAFAAAYLPFLGRVRHADARRARRRGPRDARSSSCASPATPAATSSGVLLGRHPLAPSVSPKKTWEGLAGSIVLACVVGVVGVQARVRREPLVGVILGPGHGRDRHARRPRRVAAQARPRAQGHGPAAARATAACWTGSTRSLLTAPAVYVVLTVLPARLTPMLLRSPTRAAGPTRP